VAALTCGGICYAVAALTCGGIVLLWQHLPGGGILCSLQVSDFGLSRTVNATHRTTETQVGVTTNMTSFGGEARGWAMVLCGGMVLSLVGMVLGVSEMCGYEWLASGAFDVERAGAGGWERGSSKVLLLLPSRAGDHWQAATFSSSVRPVA